MLLALTKEGFERQFTDEGKFTTYSGMVDALCDGMTCRPTIRCADVGPHLRAQYPHRRAVGANRPPAPEGEGCYRDPRRRVIEGVRLDEGTAVEWRRGGEIPAHHGECRRQG